MTVHYRKGGPKQVSFGLSVKCGVYGFMPMYSSDRRKVDCRRCKPVKAKGGKR
jgi:ribosomal protein S1